MLQRSYGYDGERFSKVDVGDVHWNIALFSFGKTWGSSFLTDDKI